MSELNEQSIQSPEAYLSELYAPDQDLLMIQANIVANNMPSISVAPAYGRLLTMFIKMIQAKDVLEIGALGGYSGACLCRGLPEDGRLVSLEIRPEFAELAHSNLQKLGFGQHVEYRIGEALDSLAKLKEEGRTFDFFFIDADKVNYPNYLEHAIELANPGAIIVGDNILMHGRTNDSSITKKSVEAMRAFNRQIATDPRLESTTLPAFDGLAIARVL
ncbi:O-methyltransferase [Paenibacillus sp. N1-5-1-14]|uniref:O-methyltransferase n=1 Tax=Paenibacillus radicibacter TaxID=2972488 RepID=UPI002158D34D|nr:O-methyltransferase [Paenibacillus radicibacter]MCR8643865.1 O-methyltransferase [Paenibacillus radicibacter]